MNIAGGALGLLGVVFVVFRLRHYAGEIEFSRFGRGDWVGIAFLCLSYGGSNWFLSKAWQKLLFYFKVPIEIRRAVRIYGLSQLAKYVPGNIFHLAGRQALGTAAGLPSGGLIKSTFWELGLIAVAGSLFSPLLVPLLWGATPYLFSLGLWGVVLSSALFFIRRIFSAEVSCALLWHCVFFVVSGSVFIALLGTVSSIDFPAPLWPALCGSYVISWLAGFITPGAPAGVGVREFVLLFLLKGLVTESDLLLVIVLGRAVTVVGDVLFFLGALLIRDSGSRAIVRTA
ncbi:hypothetical protein [Cephaloticoccus primus]|uniref:hypothetical protein n=1 Tax=Cephaloticoccus primus TaxID=1548207 RepID=UPI0018D4AFFE|nr:hypothetical protein [Cephaloticoccus primus]